MSKLSFDYSNALSFVGEHEIELQKERITIKYPIHPFYRIVYDKTYSKHTNKMYFGFAFARGVRQAFSKNIQDGMNCGFTKKY